MSACGRCAAAFVIVGDDRVLTVQDPARKEGGQSAAIAHTAVALITVIAHDRIEIVRADRSTRSR